jgi:hypothetical protein
LYQKLSLLRLSVHQGTNDPHLVPDGVITASDGGTTGSGLANGHQSGRTAISSIYRRSHSSLSDHH